MGPCTANPFTSTDPDLRDCLVAALGQETYNELATRQPGPQEQQAMGPCMRPAQDDIGPSDTGGPEGPVGPTDQNSGQDQPPETITVTYPSTSYSVAPGGTSGFFTTAQNADITLSAVGFNDTGGPLRFNRA